MASTMPTSATGGIHTLATTRHRNLNAPFIVAQDYDCEKRSSMIAIICAGVTTIGDTG